MACSVDARSTKLPQSNHNVYFFMTFAPSRSLTCAYRISSTKMKVGLKQLAFKYITIHAYAKRFLRWWTDEFSHGSVCVHSTAHTHVLAFATPDRSHTEKWETLWIVAAVEFPHCRPTTIPPATFIAHTKLKCKSAYDECLMSSNECATVK